MWTSKDGKRDMDAVRRECPECGYTVESNGKKTIVCFQIDAERGMEVDRLMSQDLIGMDDDGLYCSTQPGPC